MSAPLQMSLRSRLDAYSYQVETAADDRFWFRLVRERDRDVVTDYCLGSFPKEQSGALLAACYRTLGLTPRPTIVFSDILPGKTPADTKAFKAARDLYESAAEFLFAQFGLRMAHRRIEEIRGKVHLLIFGSAS